jgi:flagellar motor switch protein FliN/FliY
MGAQAGANATALTRALVDELAAAMGALVGVPAQATPSTSRIDAAWGVRVTVGEPNPGTITVGLARQDSAQFARLILGEADDPSDAAIVDMLQEVVGQAVGALRETAVGRGVLFCVETPGLLTARPDESPQFFQIALIPEFRPVIAVWSAFESTVTAAGVVTEASAGAGRPFAGVAAPDDTRSAAAAAPVVPANLDVILDIDLPLSVRFGQTDLTLETLTRLGPGSVIDLGRSPDDPVDVLVNGRLVARAEVVVVDGNYGVRILEVVSAADRVRSLGR